VPVALLVLSCSGVSFEDDSKRHFCLDDHCHHSWPGRNSHRAGSYHLARIIPPTECCEPIIDAAKDTVVLSNMNRKGTSSPLDLNNWWISTIGWVQCTSQGFENQWWLAQKVLLLELILFDGLEEVAAVVLIFFVCDDEPPLTAGWLAGIVESTASHQ
jgi:hypothetical protein